LWEQYVCGGSALRRAYIKPSGCVSQVMAQRKGLRNQFRSFLGIRKTGSSGGLSPEPARSGALTGRYDAATAEFQLRQLADAAFMLQVHGGR
jgi:ER-Golgi trafficking TRAPP I complex 85 kDa subunit